MIPRLGPLVRAARTRVPPVSATLEEFLGVAVFLVAVAIIVAHEPFAGGETSCTGSDVSSVLTTLPRHPYRGAD